MLTKDVKSGFFKAGEANFLGRLLSRRSLEIWDEGPPPLLDVFDSFPII